MNTRALTKRTDLTPALLAAIGLWADARTDATSPRRADLIRDKIRAVGEFFEWVGKPPDQVTPIDVKTWQAELERRELAPSTVYGMISRVSSFYTWAMADPDLAEHIKRNPVNLARPRAPKPYSSESCKSLDDDEVIALLEVVKGKADFGDLVGLRDYALVLFFIATGWRRREVLRLRWKDIKVNGGLVVYPRVKGGEIRAREVADPRVAKALVNYLQAAGRWGQMRPCDPLWTRHDRAGEPGAPLTSHAFSASLKRYARKVGIEHIHVHMFRHTFARWVSEATGSMIETQDALDHKNLSSTRVYVRSVAVKRDRHSNGILDRLGA